MERVVHADDVQRDILADAGARIVGVLPAYARPLIALKRRAQPGDRRRERVEEQRLLDVGRPSRRARGRRSQPNSPRRNVLSMWLGPWSWYGQTPTQSGVASHSVGELLAGLHEAAGPRVGRRGRSRRSRACSGPRAGASSAAGRGPAALRKCTTSRSPTSAVSVGPGIDAGAGGPGEPGRHQLVDERAERALAADGAAVPVVAAGRGDVPRQRARLDPVLAPHAAGRGSGAWRTTARRPPRRARLAAGRATARAAASASAASPGCAARSAGRRSCTAARRRRPPGGTPCAAARDRRGRPCPGGASPPTSGRRCGAARSPRPRRRA